jgi:2-succinyl-5-enolpyruvyl-6-hydroxy-3-cyclohexene-1-carboxylate synthase
MRYQPIYDIAEICVRHNIRHAVLCPGSRCAPLTLAFTRHSEIVTRTFSDERSAGFIALGMAQSLRAPVVIVCTSGTAVYNLAPAVAEAFFSRTPLIVITADRPSEWIAQHDGQTIFQHEIFGKHVKHFCQLPQDYDTDDSLWAINRMVNEALNVSVQLPSGPVHINAPFREPLYPGKGENKFSYGNVRVIHEHVPEARLSEKTISNVKASWPRFSKVLLVAGQHTRDADTIAAVASFRKKHHVPVVHDVISNLHDAGDTIQHSDLFLGQASDSLKETLRPDLLITYGDSLVSKNLKLFLRKYQPSAHWHIQPQGAIADPFKSISDLFITTPAAFLNMLTTLEPQAASTMQGREAYSTRWKAEEQSTLAALADFSSKAGLTEFSIVKALLENLPPDSNLHLANSMSVRYANFLGLHASQKGIQVFSNRGTSGIDGSSSTAVGHTLVSGKKNFLITGDLAFFYDRNAFWHNYPLGDLRVLLLNNHGGLIFDILEGPSSTPEAEEYFITRQKLNARKLCEEFDFDHLQPRDGGEVKGVLKHFLTFDSRTKILEVETSTLLNKQALENLKLKIKNSYEQ